MSMQVSDDDDIYVVTDKGDFYIFDTTTQKQLSKIYRSRELKWIALSNTKVD